jgi:hypothetical protein
MLSGLFARTLVTSNDRVNWYRAQERSVHVRVHVHRSCLNQLACEQIYTLGDVDIAQILEIVRRQRWLVLPVWTFRAESGLILR